MSIPRYMNGKPLPFSALTEEQRRRRMLGGPIVTGEYRPTERDVLRIRQKGILTPVSRIVEVTDKNGTMKIAVDENGQTVDTEKKGLTPLQMGMIAAGAYFLFGG